MKDYTISKLVNSQGLLTCSVCGKEFKPNNDTKYIVCGGYTCSWKCFLKESKKQEIEKKKNIENRHKHKDNKNNEKENKQ